MMCIPSKSNINVYNYVDKNDVTYSLSIDFEKKNCNLLDFGIHVKTIY